LEACIFDRPSFLIVPPNRPGVPAHVARLAWEQLSYTHQVEAQEQGAITWCDSADETAVSLIRAIDTPGERRGQRAALVARMCHVIDGGASHRVVDYAVTMTARGAGDLSQR
jgi:hypothetical protein